MAFRFHRLHLHDVVLVEAQAFGDDRGFFMETFRQSYFSAYGIPGTFVQANHSHSVQGVLRGLHFQKPPKAQAKLVMVVHNLEIE